jgi:hypothetical protein
MRHPVLAGKIGLMSKIRLSAFGGEAFTAMNAMARRERFAQPFAARVASTRAKMLRFDRDDRQAGSPPGSAGEGRRPSRTGNGPMTHEHTQTLGGTPLSPALEQAGLTGALPPIADRLDPRAFIVIGSRAEAEYLFSLDPVRAQETPEWTAYFVESLVEFLVWQSPPCGRISPDDLDWLAGLIAAAPSPSVPALLFALVKELNEVPELLIALAMRHAHQRFKGAH